MGGMPGMVSHLVCATTNSFSEWILQSLFSCLLWWKALFFMMNWCFGNILAWKSYWGRLYSFSHTSWFAINTLSTSGWCWWYGHGSFDEAGKLISGGFFYCVCIMMSRSWLFPLFIYRWVIWEQRAVVMEENWKCLILMTNQMVIHFQTWRSRKLTVYNAWYLRQWCAKIAPSCT